MKQPGILVKAKLSHLVTGKEDVKTKDAHFEGCRQTACPVFVMRVLKVSTRGLSTAGNELQLITD